MSCELTQRYVPGYLDGELDLVAHHRDGNAPEGCADCARELERLRALRAALQRSSLAYAAPAALRERIQSSLRAPSRDCGSGSERRFEDGHPLCTSGNWPARLRYSRCAPLAGLAIVCPPSRRLRVTSGSRRKFSTSHVRSLEAQSPDGRYLHRPAHRKTMVRRQARFFAAGRRSGGRRFSAGRRASRLSRRPPSRRADLPAPQSISSTCSCGRTLPDQARRRRSRTRGRATTSCAGRAAASSSGPSRM